MTFFIFWEDKNIQFNNSPSDANNVAQWTVEAVSEWLTSLGEQWTVQRISVEYVKAFLSEYNSKLCCFWSKWWSLCLKNCNKTGFYLWAWVSLLNLNCLQLSEAGSFSTWKMLFGWGETMPPLVWYKFISFESMSMEFDLSICFLTLDLTV